MTTNRQNNDEVLERILLLLSINLAKKTTRSTGAGRDGELLHDHVIITRHCFFSDRNRSHIVFE